MSAAVVAATAIPCCTRAAAAAEACSDVHACTSRVRLCAHVCVRALASHLQRDVRNLQLVHLVLRRLELLRLPQHATYGAARNRRRSVRRATAMRGVRRSGDACRPCALRMMRVQLRLPVPLRLNGE